MAVFYSLLFLSLCLILGTLSQLALTLTVVSVVIVIVGGLYWRNFHRFYLIIALLGLGCFAYGSSWVYWQVAHRLPLEKDKVELQLQGIVTQVKQQQRSQRLHIQLLSNSNNTAIAQRLRQVRLNYYQTESILAEQDVVEFVAVLRSPHALLNGLAFDYEAWLLGQGIDATGYIKQLTVLRPASTASVRTRLLEYWQQTTEVKQWPWLAGLVFGEQDAFDDAQWQLAKETGTLHLLVVSGMHMGLLVLLLLLLWGGLLRAYALLSRRTSRFILWWRTGFLLLGSAIYLWLAGAGIALQRAWLMLAVVLLLLNIRHRFNWLTAIACAALLVLLVNPMVWLSAGFMYSFTAVFTLLLFFNGRTSNRLEALWLPQWVIFLSMLPMLLWWQQSVSFTQLLANLLAIPWLTLVLMPLTLLTLLLPDVGQGELLVMAGECFWQWLAWVDGIPLSKLTYLPKYSLLLWFAWLLVLRSGVSYWLATTTVAAVLAVVFTQPAPQQAQAIMLDVGQGQSLVFSTAKHSLVYDSGPFMGDFDSGESIVKPVLHSLGINKIDRLVISHQDNDHAGGTAALLKAFPVGSWWGGEPLKNVPDGMQLCDSVDTAWQKLDSNFLYRYLNINKNAWKYLPDNHNNRSCVLQLQWHKKIFLLVGDIDKAIEYQLLRQYGESLKSDILVLAHHGSKTSSSEVFLKAVKPEQVWISAGFNNRFNHPATEVIERLEALNIAWLNTAEQGQIRMDSSGKIHTMRQNWQPPWRNSSSSKWKAE